MISIRGKNTTMRSIMTMTLIAKPRVKMTDISPKEILKKPYSRRVTPDEDGRFLASILEFPGCFAEGDTPVEALQALENAAESWLAVAIANGYEVRDPVDFDGYSGKVALRLPRTLHKQVAEYADLEGTSINQLLVYAISRYVGGAECLQELSTRYFPSTTIQILAWSPGAAAPQNYTERIDFTNNGLSFLNDPLSGAQTFDVSNFKLISGELNAT